MKRNAFKFDENYTCPPFHSPASTSNPQGKEDSSQEEKPDRIILFNGLVSLPLKGFLPTLTAVLMIGAWTYAQMYNAKTKLQSKPQNKLPSISSTPPQNKVSTPYEDLDRSNTFLTRLAFLKIDSLTLGNPNIFYLKLDSTQRQNIKNTLYMIEVAQANPTTVRPWVRESFSCVASILRFLVLQPQPDPDLNEVKSCLEGSENVFSRFSIPRRETATLLMFLAWSYKAFGDSEKNILKAIKKAQPIVKNHRILRRLREQLIYHSRKFGQKYFSCIKIFSKYLTSRLEVRTKNKYVAKQDRLSISVRREPGPIQVCTFPTKVELKYLGGNNLKDLQLVLKKQLDLRQREGNTQVIEPTDPTTPLAGCDDSTVRINDVCISKKSFSAKTRGAAERFCSRRAGALPSYEQLLSFTKKLKIDINSQWVNGKLSGYNLVHDGHTTLGRTSNLYPHRCVFPLNEQ